jgi:hypothetical protein
LAYGGGSNSCGGLRPAQAGKPDDPSLTANLTPLHAEAVVRGLNGDVSSIRALLNSVFVQAFVTLHLILDMLDVAIN